MTAHPARLRLVRSTALAVVAGSLALSACTQRDRDEAKADAKQATAETKADARQAGAELKADLKQAGAELKADAKQLGADLKAGAKDAMADLKAKTADVRAEAAPAIDKAKAAVADATITASVKAELAKDAVLKARDIDVDTSGGRVVLRGTAPTAEARERAKTLAGAVSGVVSVSNELTVGS